MALLFINKKGQKCTAEVLIQQFWHICNSCGCRFRRTSCLQYPSDVKVWLYIGKKANQKPVGPWWRYEFPEYGLVCPCFQSVVACGRQKCRSFSTGDYLLPRVTFAHHCQQVSSQVANKTSTLSLFQWQVPSEEGNPLPVRERTCFHDNSYLHSSSERWCRTEQLLQITGRCWAKEQNLWSTL